MIWESDMVELVIGFIDEPFSRDAAENIIQAIGFNTCSSLYAPCSAAHLILVHSGSEYAFTADDLDCIDVAKEVLLYKITSEVSLFFANMDCCEDDYYCCCSAVIKVLNVAFPLKNIYIFKVNKSVAVGSARNFENSMPNNFTVSALIKKGQVKQYEDFLVSLYYSDICEVPFNIMQNSPQEDTAPFVNDRVIKNLDYLSFLSEFQSFYGVDTSRERARFSSSDGDQSITTDTYKSTCYKLYDVAEKAQVSSYEDLDAAAKAEEKASHAYIGEDSEEHIFENDTIEDKFSGQAFENAETMLKEMLDKDNDRKEV